MHRRLVLLACLAASGIARAEGGAHYDLDYDAGTRTLQVSLCLDRAAALRRFAGDASAPSKVEGVGRSGEGRVQRDGDGWSARDWRAGECLRWRVDPGRIAAREDRGRRTTPDAAITDPGGWLLMADGVDTADVRVRLPRGIALSVPWTPLPSDAATRRYRIARTPPDWLARAAIGRLDEATLDVAGGRLHVALAGGLDAAPRERLLAWLRRVGTAATTASGALPLPDVQVLVVPVGTPRDAVVFGQSTRGQGNGLTLFVDPAHAASAFERDWIAIHELSHLFHPHLGARGAWLAEGLATYLQNVLRARAGLLTPAQAWAELDDGFARGRRDTPDDATTTLEQASLAMEREHGFSRVYWSGTAYWLGIDLELRRAQRPGVDEVLRRFAGCCLPSAHSWASQAFVAKLDALAGTTLFTSRWHEYRALHRFPDLPDPRSSADRAIRARIMQPVPGAGPANSGRSAALTPHPHPSR